MNEDEKQIFSFLFGWKEEDFYKILINEFVEISV